MPRQRRVVIPHFPHHITQRGNNRRDIFFADGDRQLYLTLLREYSAEYDVAILGYCLMTNHVHVIASPATAHGLAKALGRTHNDYARWLNIRRRESGHVWQNRFFSCPVETRYLWAVLAYVERNPLRAKLVSQCDEWRWSSARAHTSYSEAGWLSDEAWTHNWTPASWRVVLEQGLGDGEISARLAEATQTGRPLGDDEFVDSCESLTQLRLKRHKPGPKPNPNVGGEVQLACFAEGVPESW